MKTKVIMAIFIIGAILALTGISGMLYYDYLIYFKGAMTHYAMRRSVPPYILVIMATVGWYSMILVGDKVQQIVEKAR